MVLSNGLTLLAQAVADAPAVAVVSYLRAGFFDEPDRLAGVSHVLEHMLFKGTPTVRSVSAGAVQRLARQSFAPERGGEGMVRGTGEPAMFRPHG